MMASIKDPPNENAAVSRLEQNVSIFSLSFPISYQHNVSINNFEISRPSQISIDRFEKKGAKLHGLFDKNFYDN